MKTVFVITAIYALYSKCATTMGRSASYNVSSGSQQKSSSRSSSDAVALSTNKALTTALNQNTASKLSPQAKSRFMSGDPNCAKNAINGNWQVVNEELQQQCYQKAQELRQNADKLVKMVNNPKQNICTRKLNQNALVCQARAVLNEMMHREKYKIRMHENVMEVLRDGQPMLLGVVENMHYNVEKKVQHKPSPLSQPTVELSFNDLGSLVKQKGEIAIPKDSDPCVKCLESLSKKSATEGQQDECGGCDSMMELTNINNAYFKNLKKTEGKDTGEEEKTTGKGKTNRE